MKNMTYFLIIVFLCTVNISAQKHKGPKGDAKFRQKIEQLEKIKLLEVLNLDEETTLKFFARQNANRDNIFKIDEKKREIVDQLEEYFISGKELQKGESFESLNKKMLELEKKIVNHKIEFVKSLNDILSDEQISKLIVFESKFREEIRDMILDKRGGGSVR